MYIDIIIYIYMYNTTSFSAIIPHKIKAASRRLPIKKRRIRTQGLTGLKPVTEKIHPNHKHHQLHWQMLTLIQLKYTGYKGTYLCHSGEFRHCLKEMTSCQHAIKARGQCSLERSVKKKEGVVCVPIDQWRYEPQVVSM